MSIVSRLMVVPLLLACVVVMPAQAKAETLQALAWQDAIWLAEVDGATAAKIVQRNTGGKVLGVHRQEKKGKTVYRVKVLLPEGRVRTVTVDAETGRMGG